MRLREFG
jgi:hypothetical protein